MANGMDLVKHWQVGRVTNDTVEMCYSDKQ